MAAFGLPELTSLYDPSIGVDQIALQRQMALAQALRQQAMTPINPNRQIGGMGYRVSPLEAVAKVFQTMQANRMDQQTDAERLDLMQRMGQAYAAALRGDQPGSVSPTASAPVDANGGRPAGVSAQAMEAGGFPQPSQPATPSAPAPAPQGGNFTMGNLVRGGLINDIGGPAMGAAYAKNFETPEAIRVLQAEGLDPRTMGAAELAAKRAAALKEFRPGTAAGSVDANGNFNLQFYNPQVDKGILPSWNSNGQVAGVSEAPGYGDIAAGIAGKRAMAESAAGVHMVKDAGGRELPVRVPAPGSGTPATGLAGGVATGVAPSVAGSPSPAATAAALRASAPPASAPAHGTATAPGGINWSTLPLRPQPTGLGQSSFDAKDQENLANLKTELAKKYNDAAEAAAKRMATNNQALDQLSQADTGPGAEFLGDFKNVLVSRFPSFFKESDFQNTPSSTAVLNKDLMNAAIQRAREVFNNPRMTQQEVMQYLGKGAPNIEMPKAALTFLLQTDNAQSQYLIQKGADFGTAMSKSGDPGRFEEWYTLQKPPYSAIEGFKLPPGKKPAQTESAPAQVSAPKGLVKNDDGSFTYHP